MRCARGLSLFSDARLADACSVASRSQVAARQSSRSQAEPKQASPGTHRLFISQFNFRSLRLSNDPTRGDDVTAASVLGLVERNEWSPGIRTAASTKPQTLNRSPWNHSTSAAPLTSIKHTLSTMCFSSLFFRSSFRHEEMSFCEGRIGRRASLELGRGCQSVAQR